MVLVAVEASTVVSKPSTAVGERISEDGRHDLGDAAPFLTKTSSLQGMTFWSRTAREIGRFGLHAETDRGLRSGLNFLCSTAIPMHRLNYSSGTLRALASLNVCGPVCLHGKTWLPSILL